MEHLRFAVCIVFPGTTSADVDSAAIKHNVHILDQQRFDPFKDYGSLQKYTLDNGATILPLFLFSDGALSGEDEPSFRKALERIRQYSVIE